MGLFNFFSGSKPFTQKDIPPLTDKVILVTGGNNGLGKQSILDLARHSPAHIYLGARSAAKATAAIADIRTQLGASNTTPITFLELDLASFASIKTAAKTLLAATPRLDLLLCNAGIMATPAGLTRDGYEVQFGTNHVGHALLGSLLLPALRGAGDGGARVVVLSSGAHNWTHARGVDFGSLKGPAEEMSTVARYGQSKLANALWAREWARRVPDVFVVAVHPGVVGTNLFQSLGERSWVVRNVAPMFLTNVEVGVRNQLWAACAEVGEGKGGPVSGEYYEPVGVPGKASKWARDDDLARRLWEWTEKEIEGVKI
ncbi:hypothetical protein SLS56_005032 [Neofusicoccum ribis]|uniref:Oxidoreductase n=1 Tax=Neofusicoccum ribis TaxID=45134 RepID=A0ABR3SUV3_9PEZI